MDPKFIHLNVHSDYSFKDGLCKINKLIKNLLKIKMPSIALTDFTNLSASIKFFNKCYIEGIKPVIGIDIYIHYDNYISWGNESHLITILVMNLQGFKNLVKLISLAYLNNKSSLDTISLYFKHILDFNEGLIFLFSFDKFSCLGKLYIFKDFILIKDKLLFWKKILNNRIYLNIYRVLNIDENIYINNIMNLSYETKIPVVATNRVLFFKKKDYFLNKIRSSIYYNCNLNNIYKYINYTEQQYLKNEYEMCCLFSDIPEALYNSVQITQRCNFILNKMDIVLPNFKIKNNEKPEKYIVKLSYKNLYKRIIFNKNNLFKKEKYLLRLENELNIINKMFLANYFLIVMEFVQWAKKHNIPVGPGRGSGAGSLVAYVLYITDIDPLKFDLIFERFINLERISIPDFDIDFCMLQRDKVLSHIENLYGKQSVAQIVTFNKLTAKSVIRDVGRVLGYSYNFIDYIAKLIPFNIGITLKKALIMEHKLLHLYKNNIEVKKLIYIASKLEGFIKGLGKHAGGIVISPSLVDDYCPIFFDFNDNKIITQLDKKDIEYVGLIKFDLLGLRTLTIIDKTLKLIFKNKKKIININNLSLKDKNSFRCLKQADTVAIFQLESKGMRLLIQKLKPDKFEDIIALLALFRPGPLKSGMVDNYIKRKHGYEKIYYPHKNIQHKLLKPILKCTYGIILYQEQIMEIAKVLANYDLGLADILRRSISSKNKNDIKYHRKIFKKGSKKLGINVDLSSKIFSLIEKSSGYGFNKSHSVSYAYIAYQTLWLKSNYFIEFIVSVMNSYINDFNKIKIMIYEAKKHNIKIIFPNINISDYYFKIDNQGNIIYGLGAIKGIGKSSIKYILKIRSKNKIFKNFIEFCILTFSSKINKLVLESLIFSGSFDLFKINRYVLYKNIKYVLNIASIKNRNSLFKQRSFLKDDFIKEINLYKNINYNNKTSFLFKKEFEVLGLYVTNHPINKYIKLVKKKFNIIDIKNIYFLKGINKIYIFGLIIMKKIFFTKNKDKIYIFYINDYTGIFEIIISEYLYLKNKKLFKINNIIIIFGIFKNNIYGYKNCFIFKNIIFFKKYN